MKGYTQKHRREKYIITKNTITKTKYVRLVLLHSMMLVMHKINELYYDDMILPILAVYSFSW